MNEKFKIYDSVIFEYDLEMIQFRFEEVGSLVDNIIILESKSDLKTFICRDFFVCKSFKFISSCFF